MSRRVELFFVVMAGLLSAGWIWRGFASSNGDWLYWTFAAIWAVFAGFGLLDLRRTRSTASGVDT